jgi:ribosomal protein L29
MDARLTNSLLSCVNETSVLYSVGLFLFKCQVPEIPFQIICGDDEVCIEFRPIIICMWEMDPELVVERQQRCLYHLLPTMNRPSVDLLKQALREMHEHDDPERFGYHVEWFDTMLSRTTTVSDEDKNIIQEHLRMHYQLHPLLAENPTIQSVIAEGIAEGIAKEVAKEVAKAEAESEARGIARGLQDGIIDLINDHFSAQVVTRVQQTIAPAQNVGQLRQLHRQIARVSSEEEVDALLAQYFPVQDEQVRGEIKGMRQAILDITETRFSSQAVTQVQQAIAPIQDLGLLRKFHRQLAGLSNEQAVLALLEHCFPVQ